MRPFYSHALGFKTYIDRKYKFKCQVFVAETSLRNDLRVGDENSRKNYILPEAKIIYIRRESFKTIYIVAYGTLAFNITFTSVFQYSNSID